MARLFTSYITVGSILGVGSFLTNIYTGTQYTNNAYIKGIPKSAIDMRNKAASKGMSYFGAWPIILATDIYAELHRPKGHDHSAFYLYSCRQCAEQLNKTEYHGLCC